MATTKTKAFVISSLIHRSSVLGVCTSNDKYFQEHGNLGHPKKTTFLSTKGCKNVTCDVACKMLIQFANIFESPSDLEHQFNKVSCGTC